MSTSAKRSDLQTDAKKRSDSEKIRINEDNNGLDAWFEMDAISEALEPDVAKEPRMKDEEIEWFESAQLDAPEEVKFEATPEEFKEEEDMGSLSFWFDEGNESENEMNV